MNHTDANQLTANESLITPQLLQKYDIPGPRYTSYPTADRFVEAFNDESYQQALEQRQIHGQAVPLSIYVHIPFCESLCLYCACNKVITKQHSRGTQYINYLYKEIDLHLQHFGHHQTVSQLHLGGGSPTFLNDEELSQLMLKLQQDFSFVPGGEYSIEIDPRTIDLGRLQHLKTLGFNRLSFGVQDFDADVQQAVNRIQPEEQVRTLVDAAHREMFDSVNIDLIYGLPKQNVTSFKETIKKVISIRPDRIALYAYAHLPERFKPQRSINKDDLPVAASKLQMLSSAISLFLDAGYVYIGMDHFALPSDSLAIAKRQGRLHRNFQGYSTQPDCDIIGLGVSAIGRVGAAYNQNAKTINDYYDLLDQGRFPTARGLALSWDDLVRRSVIMAIMCQGELQFESIDLTYMIDFKTYFQHELIALQSFTHTGMLELNDDSLYVTPTGWYFVRAIAMVFDRYLQADQNRARFSKII